MVSGPKLAPMLEEFKGNISAAEDHHHYGQKHGFQSAFAKDFFFFFFFFFFPEK